MKMSIVLMTILCLFLLAFIAGCTSNTSTSTSSSTPPIQPAENVPITTPSTAQTIPVLAPSQNYKTANIIMTSQNSNPKYGFEMDYPTNWSNGKEESNEGWTSAYNFSSPDSKSFARVYIDTESGSAAYWYPLNTWAGNVINASTMAYCLDGAGNPMNTCSDVPATDYRYHVLSSNDPATIMGSFEARKLVFISNDDPNFGQDTQYLLHAGSMQGYNFTLPGHYELAQKVNGPAWDYAMGGTGYVIEFYSSSDQVNATSDIFSHMINSFEVTTKNS